MTDTDIQPVENTTVEQAPVAVPEAFSVDELKQMATPQPEVKEPVEEVVESEEGGETDEPIDAPLAEDTAEAKEERKAKKQRWEREYEGKITERARADAEKARADKAEAKAAEIEKWVAKALADEKPAVESEEEDIIDTKTEKRVASLEKELVTAKVNNALRESYDLGAKHVPDFGVMRESVIAAYANMALVEAKAKGMPMNNETALGAAVAHVNKQLGEIHLNGGNTGQMAQYIVDQANAFRVDVAEAKKLLGMKPEAPKVKINMKAVEEAREKAGAPAIVKETVKFANTDWTQSAAVDLKEKGYSKTYLEKFGIAS